MTTKAPDKLTLITWNIDGLSEKSLKGRCRAIAKQIEEDRADVVFLQEVIPITLEYLERKLPNYEFIAESQDTEYFTATLLRRGTVILDSNLTVPFEGSRMGRNLAVVAAHIGKAKLLLMNTHLESTKVRTEEIDLKSAYSKFI